MRWQRGIAVLGCTVATGIAGSLQAAEPAPPARQSDEAPATRTQLENQQDGKILAARTFRVSKLIGMNVRNMEGKALGTIDDIVVDVRTGKVQYAAMSVGGVLGIGDKLLAVPFDKLTFDHGQDEMFFVLNMPEEKIAVAPGFNQDDWPDFADPKWTAKIDKHYPQTETRTGATETERGEPARETPEN